MTRGPGLFVLGALLCLLGLSFGAPALLLAGLGLGLLAAVAVAWVSLAARRCAVTRSVSHRLAQEGEAFTVTVELRRGLIPAPGGSLAVWPDLALQRLGSKRTETVRVRVSFDCRGRHVVAPARALIADPLGLCVRERRSQADEVLVLPRVTPITGPHAEGVTGGASANSGAAQTAALEIDTLRPHRPGTPASRIHWPTVARTGTLMEHRLVSDVDRRALIVLDARDPASTEALDEAVRAVASLAHHLALHGGCGVLLPGEHRPTTVERDLRTWPALHARLALVGAGSVLASPTRLAHAGMLLWVLARPLPSRGAPARMGLARGYVVTPFPPMGRAVAFTAAGCAGHALQSGPRAQVA